MTNAGNTWWWGIDDVEVSGRESVSGVTAGVPLTVGTQALLHESFEGIADQYPVHETTCPNKKSWTAAPPNGQFTNRTVEQAYSSPTVQ